MYCGLDIMTVSDQSVSLHAKTESFVFKSTSLSMPVLELRSNNLDEIEQTLIAKISSAPAFFKQCPIVFSFKQLAAEQRLELAKLVTLCRNYGILPLGIQGDEGVYQQELAGLHLAHFENNKAKPVTPQPEAVAVAPVVEVEPEPAVDSVPSPSHKPAKIVSDPIRSGQQLYAAGDMIILSSVSAGAEILAEGNIHVYGALRGRALAGVKGDLTARIFCHSQEAELLSIAGHFMIDEELRKAHWKTPAQVYLQGEELTIKSLTL